MNISNFLDLNNKDYILYLKKDKNGIHLHETKKGFLTWISVKLLKRDNYQLATVVDYVNKQGNQLVAEEWQYRALINKLNQKIGIYKQKREHHISAVFIQKLQIDSAIKDSVKQPSEIPLNQQEIVQPPNLAPLEQSSKAAGEPILAEKAPAPVEQKKPMKLLFKGTEISGKWEVLNFASIESEGKRELGAVIGNPRIDQYEPYEGSAYEALLKIAQDKEPAHGFYSGRHYGSPISYFLNHPDNTTINEEEFFKFILAKDERDNPRICTLNTASTLEMLQLVKEKNIPLNLGDKDSEGKTLFTIWAGRGNADITRLLLEVDPLAIKQVEGQIESPFVQATLNLSKIEAKLLIDAMEKHNVCLSKEETWISKTYKGDCLFSDEEFMQLDPELKTKIYFVANSCVNEEMVRKLKTLGMGEEPLIGEEASIFAHNMDIIMARSTIEKFLKDLKNNGLLITQEKFEEDIHDGKYISKGTQIGRIQGKQFVDKMIRENGLEESIKVPRKIAVIKKGIQTISLSINEILELKGKELEIYAERIIPVDRKLSLKEAIGVMILVEKTRYSDVIFGFKSNFLVAQDGVYLIDTELENFPSTDEPQFAFIQSLVNFLENPADKAEFLKEYEKRKKNYEEESRKNSENPNQAALKNPYENLREGYGRHKFIFQVDSL